MRLLLDTHVWLWLSDDSPRLSGRVAKQLKNPSNELWLSPLSLWEVSLLADRHRIDLDQPVQNWISTWLGAMPMHEASITFEVALETARLQFRHKDPVDRFLAGSAIVYDLTLVTADSELLAGQGYAKLANR